MSKSPLYLVNKSIIAAVWLVNGLLCKVLNLVPRHELIVARILGVSHAEAFTRLIGFTEILMAAWILIGFRSRLCTLIQMIVIAVMNIIELVAAKDLLLWGGWNIVFAFLFIAFIGFTEVLSARYTEHAINLNQQKG